MPDTSDLWYIRFPDGRVLSAAGTFVVRQQLSAGRLPVGTRLRRSLDDEWRSVERWSEFADLAPNSADGIAPRDGASRVAPATIASRLDPAVLHLAGVRDLFEEMLAALDSSLVRSKLLAAVPAGLLLGGLCALAGLPEFGFGVWPTEPGWALPALGLLVWSWLAVMLSRMTYVELSRLRPARWRDGFSGCVGPTIHLALAQGLLGLLIGGLLAGLRWLPGWLLTAGNDNTAHVFSLLAQVVAVGGMVAEVILWPTLLLMLPLGAMVVVDGGSFLSALRQWAQLVRQRPGRLLLAEALALGVGLVLAVPLALLLGALATRQVGPDFALAEAITLRALVGLVGAVLLAYLVVANVFIYLHLRYER